MTGWLVPATPAPQPYAYNVVIPGLIMGYLFVLAVIITVWLTANLLFDFFTNLDRLFSFKYATRLWSMCL
jgi:hypothetical protein